MGSFKLAVKYIGYNRWKTLILVGCIFLTLILPVGIKLLLQQFNDNLLSRARATPVVLGAKGSPLDLTLHALYYKTNIPGSIPVSEIDRILDEGLADAVPISCRHTARRFPIVGTTSEYFEKRNLQIHSGSSFAMLGECVLGWQVAARLKLGVGDSLLSDRENVIDIAGHYPLKMKIVGVLAESKTADDSVVFADLNTVWVIAGLGHGHEDVAESEPDKILRKSETNIVASAAVLPYTEVTEENLDSFHFHGNPDEFPITAILAFPHDFKSQTILEGRYDTESSTIQFVIPQEQISDLMEVVFRIKTFFDVNAVLVAISTILLMALVITLSLRLRRREMQTLFRMGCSRGTVVLIQVWELSLIILLSIGLVAVTVWMIGQFGLGLLESLLFRENQ